MLRDVLRRPLSKHAKAETSHCPNSSFCRAVFVPAASTPKSQTKRFIPPGRISASAYSPGGSGLAQREPKDCGATSHRSIEIESRFSSICWPKRLRIDSNCRLSPLTIARTNSTSGPDSPGRLLFTMGVAIRIGRRFAQIKFHPRALYHGSWPCSPGFAHSAWRNNGMRRKHLLQKLFLVRFYLRAHLLQWRHVFPIIRNIPSPDGRNTPGAT